jgi:hypothetical protein
MRAPSNRRSTDRRIDDEAAIEEASRRLRRLFVDVISDTSSPKKKFRAAIGLVDGALDEAGWALNTAEYALNEGVKCHLNKRAKDAIADAIPSVADAIAFIKLARKTAIPELRQARPATGPRWGRHRDLNASRNQTIAETVVSIREQFGLSQEQASWVVSQALESLVDEHKRVFERLIKERGADPVWIDECRKFVDKLRLSEDASKTLRRSTEPFLSKILTLASRRKHTA